MIALLAVRSDLYSRWAANAQVTEDSEIDISRTAYARVPQEAEGQVPRSTNAQVPGSTYAEVLEEANIDIPEQTDADIPRSSDGRVPEQSQIGVPRSPDVNVSKQREPDIVKAEGNVDSVSVTISGWVGVTIVPPPVLMVVTVLQAARVSPRPGLKHMW